MTEASKPTIHLLVVDLDNTLWDWFDAWHVSFQTLLAALSTETKLPVPTLEDAIRQVHQQRGTTEYSWLLEELRLLKRFAKPGETVRQRFDHVLHQQNSARKHATMLYPGVADTLASVRAAGVPVVAYTESLAFWTEWRIKRVGLDGVIDRLYSSPDHDAPTGLDPEDVRTLPPEEYGLKHTAHHHVPEGVSKPNASVLRQIMREYRVDAVNVAYVGDSLMKDVRMGQAAEVHDVHAAYGDPTGDPRYVDLVRVSHWSDHDIRSQGKRTAEAQPVPSYVLSEGFHQLLGHFEFRPRTSPDPFDAALHVDLWKQAVEVQQHFNDLEWRIRSLAITALTFIVGGSLFGYLNAEPIELFFGAVVNPAAGLPLLGMLIWCMFWFADGKWYHPLLIGAVRTAEELERSLRQHGVQARLSSNITAASHVKVWFRQAKSSRKLRGFYIRGLLVLLAVSAAILFVPSQPSMPPSPSSTTSPP